MVMVMVMVMVNKLNTTGFNARDDYNGGWRCLDNSHLNNLEINVKSIQGRLIYFIFVNLVPKVPKFWSWHILTNKPSFIANFQLGVDFDEKTADMRDVRTRGVFEAGKLILVEKVSVHHHLLQIMRKSFSLFIKNQWFMLASNVITASPFLLWLCHCHSTIIK